MLNSPVLVCVTNNKSFLSYAPESTIPKMPSSYLKDTQQHDISVRYAYTHSYDDKKLRAYFFPNNNSTLMFGDRDSASNPDKSNVDIDYRFFISVDDTEDRTVTLTMKPEQQVHYVEANYYKPFHIKNLPLFFMLHFPFISVSNQLKPSFTPQHFPLDENAHALADFFAGNFENTTAHHLQAPLEALTFTRNKKTSGGLGDVQIKIGWEAVKRTTLQAHVAAGILFPTSNKPKGKTLFEPMRGNNGHWGFTLHGECTKKFWAEEMIGLEINVINDLLYLIQNTQTRTAGIKSLPWGHYALLGKNGATNKPLLPAANILTGQVTIDPGIQINSAVTATLVNPYVNVGIGYSLFVKSEDSVRLKEEFPEATYGIASFGVDTSAEFTQASTLNGYWLRAQDIDLSTAQTPSQVIHGIHCAITKIIEQNNISWKINAGAQTSFTPQNSSPVGYTVWALLGLSF